MYSTCIGLILKGYNDYENKNKQQFEETWRKIAVPVALQQPAVEEVLDVPEVEEEEIVNVKKTKERKSLKGFMDSFKIGLIDLFKEEEDGKF
jgi:cell division protein FtsA